MLIIECHEGFVCYQRINLFEFMLHGLKISAFLSWIAGGVGMLGTYEFAQYFKCKSVLL